MCVMSISFTRLKTNSRESEPRFVTGQNFVIDGGMTRKMICEE